jgi:ribosomal-protein-alanine N-acetyltransferase
VSAAASLQTGRLVLEPLAQSHSSALHRAMSDPVTLAYWHTTPHATPDETSAMIAAMITPPEACWWAIREQAGAQAIGFVGFLGTSVPGMGYLIQAPYWRRGYGAEAVTTALGHGFTELGLNRVELWIHAGNVASQRLAARCGFRQRGQFYQRPPRFAEAYETLVYGLRAGEWAAQSGLSPANTLRDPPFGRVDPVLLVPDVLATAQFYQRRLGFEIGYIGGDPPDFAIVSRGEWSAPRAHIQLRAGTQAPVGVALYLQVDTRLDVLFAEFSGRGARVVRPIEAHPWGMRDFIVEDCNGVLLTFAAPA